MQYQNSDSRYGSITKVFHWLFFLFFVFQFVVAELMTDMPKGPDKWEMYGWHKSIGMILLVLVFFRFGWRLLNRQPKMPDSISPLEQKLAHLGHYLLYVVMFVMPMSGYIMSMAGGHGIEFFGLFSIPDIIGLNKTLGGISHEVHEITMWIIYILVGGHIFFAVYNHKILKNNTLKKMIPFGKP